MICDWWQQSWLPGWCWIISSSWFSYGSSGRANLSIDLRSNALPVWVNGAWPEYSQIQKPQQARGQMSSRKKGFGSAMANNNLTVSWILHIWLNKGLGRFIIRERLMFFIISFPVSFHSTCFVCRVWRLCKYLFTVLWPYLPLTMALWTHFPFLRI